MPTPSAGRRCPEARRHGGRQIVVAAAALALGLLAPRYGRAYLDSPAPGHTGGFGEPSCAACHAAAPEDATSGSLTLAAPELFLPGEEHVLEVRLAHAGMERAGFQLSARYLEGTAAGRQAGTLTPVSQAVRLLASHEVTYAAHSAAGAEARDGGARWRIRWTAPAAPTGPVVFHVAANAANFDDSEFGDFVYLASAVSRPR